jgi:hypothetical protein
MKRNKAIKKGKMKHTPLAITTPVTTGTRVR